MMIPVALLVELGVKLISAGLAAIRNGRDEVSDEEFALLQAEFKKHGEQWAKLFEHS